MPYDAPPKPEDHVPHQRAATLIDITALALLGLAGYRATQLAVHDTISIPAGRSGGPGFRRRLQR